MGRGTFSLWIPHIGGALISQFPGHPKQYISKQNDAHGNNSEKQLQTQLDKNTPVQGFDKSSFPLPTEGNKDWPSCRNTQVNKFSSNKV